ncbi:MAG TPA: CDP-alcohol phosphatidyltransferase family protein [Anaerolinea thermolimosa]|uniref:CDP-alcohol phosphatidyltransferase family protein n=1 Tax=Anaerolinea thermolimosa TaxID=229919 RepID=A0A3D1JCW5_9CHLR|nr:CDP-alcohol phosphatidyltransferase family protein [Anaerolinea thermolimosa]GAP05680.1 phosphatidylglycerophosphate synthase [Anaerolinea thermolimosa]HCE16372.1 CDP-alcohol phosphatidyltransferase family protein [Anaerolinea thermolimosa]
MQQIAREDPVTFTDVLRKRFKYLLDPMAAFLNRLGLMPNTVTILGLVGNTIGAYLLATGQITWGGIVILLMGPIDALDGTMARLRGEPTEFGAFVDSVTDRYSELVIFLGLMVYYALAGNWLACVLVYLAAAGSVLVSYVRARAQSLGMEAKVGIFTRVERFLVLAPCLIFNQPMIALWAIAILANVTAVQRIYHVRVQAHQKRQ